MHACIQIWENMRGKSRRDKTIFGVFKVGVMTNTDLDSDINQIIKQTSIPFYNGTMALNLPLNHSLPITSLLHTLPI